MKLQPIVTIDQFEVGDLILYTVQRDDKSYTNMLKVDVLDGNDLYLVRAYKGQEKFSWNGYWKKNAENFIRDYAVFKVVEDV